MYQKYITRKGKKTGPYYYESFRLKNGKIKTIYLGKTPDKEKLAEAIKKLRISIEDVVKNGETRVIPVESRTVKDSLALAEIFKDVIVKTERRLILPRFRLPKIEVKEIDLFNWFKKDSEQKKLEEFIPTPGKPDFNFEILLFTFIAFAYILGFFFLEASITGYAVADVTTSGNSFPILMGIVNLFLVLLIYLDLKND